MMSKNDMEDEAITSINDGYFNDAIRALLEIKGLSEDNANYVINNFENDYSDEMKD